MSREKNYEKRREEEERGGKWNVQERCRGGYWTKCRCFSCLVPSLPPTRAHLIFISSFFPSFNVCLLYRSHPFPPLLSSPLLLSSPHLISSLLYSTLLLSSDFLLSFHASPHFTSLHLTWLIKLSMPASFAMTGAEIRSGIPILEIFFTMPFKT